MHTKAMLATFVAVCAIATSAGAATTLTLTNVTMNSPMIVSFSGPGINENVEDSVLWLTTGSGQILPAFCVDIWHPMVLGPADLTYRRQALTTDSSGLLSGTGTALSIVQIGEIGGLVNVGETLIGHPDANIAIDLAGIQAAIWSIEDPAVTIAGDSELNDRISYYETFAAAHPSTRFSTFYDVAGESQGVAIAAPEPAAWSLMLLGFGGLGAAIRMGRRRTAVGSNVAERRIATEHGLLS
jgi:hypothetical protein